MRILGLLLCMTMSCAAADLAQLEFLSGCWATSGSGPMKIEEHWSKPAGGNMTGYSRTFKANRLAFYEFLRLDAKGDDIFYTPRLSNGQKEVSFRLVKLAQNEAIFENPEHDFPQRILYKREGDKLHAAIEGRQNGKERRESFPYSRVSCP